MQPVPLLSLFKVKTKRVPPFSLVLSIEREATVMSCKSKEMKEVNTMAEVNSGKKNRIRPQRSLKQARRNI